MKDDTYIGVVKTVSTGVSGVLGSINGGVVGAIALLISKAFPHQWIESSYPVLQVSIGASTGYIAYRGAKIMYSSTKAKFESFLLRDSHLRFYRKIHGEDEIKELAGAMTEAGYKAQILTSGITAGAVMMLA